MEKKGGEKVLMERRVRGRRIVQCYIFDTLERRRRHKSSCDRMLDVIQPSSVQHPLQQLAFAVLRHAPLKDKRDYHANKEASHNHIVL
jgi:hypothetical protein